MRQSPFLRGTIAIALAIAGFATVGASSADAGSSRTPTVISVPLTIEPEAYTDIEACIHESVTITSGTYRLLLTEGGSGTLFHANVVNGTAVGNLSGATFRVIGHSQEVVNSQPKGAYVYVSELRLRIIGLNGAPSFNAHAYWHVTVTPDGTAIIDRGAWVLTC